MRSQKTKASADEKKTTYLHKNTKKWVCRDVLLQ